MDNNSINTIIRSLSKFNPNPDVYQNNDIITIKYQIGNLGSMMINMKFDDWIIIQERMYRF